MDVHTKEQRSYNMSRIRSKNTLPEKIMFKELRNAGIKFSKHNKKLPGKPDIAIIDRKIAVFINGEFWHGRNFEVFKKRIPLFWVKKIGGNIKRDRRNLNKLRLAGWHVINLWDKKILKNPEAALSRIKKLLSRMRDKADVTFSGKGLKY